MGAVTIADGCGNGTGNVKRTIKFHFEDGCHDGTGMSNERSFCLCGVVTGTGTTKLSRY